MVCVCVCVCVYVRVYVICKYITIYMVTLCDLFYAYAMFFDSSICFYVIMFHKDMYECVSLYMFAYVDVPISHFFLPGLVQVKSNLVHVINEGALVHLLSALSESSLVCSL